jgi:putative transposase
MPTVLPAPLGFFEPRPSVFYPIICTLPEGDTDHPNRWKSFKRRVSNALGPIWQDRCWEHSIRSDGDLAHHVNYVHYNPVKHGHVEAMDDWPYSSWHRWKVESGHHWEMPPEELQL